VWASVTVAPCDAAGTARRTAPAKGDFFNGMVFMALFDFLLSDLDNGSRIS
jgi:hypothetical protein